MNILIDFTQIPVVRTGVGVYADHLVQELPALLQSSDRLFILAQDDELSLPTLLRSHAQVTLLTIPARPFRNRAALLFYEQFILPFLLLRHRIDVLHSLHYTHPLWAPCARAVTIHDLTFSLFPELHTRGRRLLFPFFIRRAIRAAECPIFVSQSTQQDAERLFGPSRHPGHIAPLGVSAPKAALNDEQAKLTIATLGISAPFFLFIGTIEPRKNLLRLLQAFEEIAAKHPEYALVLAGKLGWHSAEFLAALASSPVRDRIHHLGFVTEEQKQALLATCNMLVYPSLYEGFGLPVLEAMTHGAPVITSNVSSLPEVAGNATMLVDPTSIEEIAGAMDELACNPKFAMRLRRAGVVRAATFTWKQTAELTYKAYLGCTNSMLD